MEAKKVGTLAKGSCCSQMFYMCAFGYVSLCTQRSELDLLLDIRRRYETCHVFFSREDVEQMLLFPVGLVDKLEN